MSSEELFKELDSYDWDGDKEYQIGLNGILDSAKPSSDDQKQNLELKAKCFYFAR
jgi:hypothetical protein